MCQKVKHCYLLLSLSLFLSLIFIFFGGVSLEERKNIKRCFDEIPSKYYDKTFGVPGVKMSMDLAKRLVN